MYNTRECGTLPFLAHRLYKGCDDHRSAVVENEKWKNMYARGGIYIEASRSSCALNAKRRMFYVRVHIFLPSPSEASPETFFLDSISRLPRDRIVEMARALFRVSCRKDEGAGCDGAYCPIPTCGKWKEPSNEERKTNRFSCECRIVFMRNPSMRVLARVERISMWIAVRFL